MQNLLTTKEVAKYFQVTDETVTQKFIKEGLEYFPVSAKDYRYNEKDVLKFEEQRKKQAQQQIAMQNKTLILNNIKQVKFNQKNAMRVS